MRMGRRMSETPLSSPLSIESDVEKLTDLQDQPTRRPYTLSRFEEILASRGPILESLLQQLPTPSLLCLYHTSRFLRYYLQSYPIAWKYLSFRLINNASTGLGAIHPDIDISDSLTLHSKPYALDRLLVEVVVPFGTRLCNLDLDNTAVSGQTLTQTILPWQSGTLQHLSVRGCKNVSLKYHIVPYLTIHSLQRVAALFNPLCHVEKLSLKSLYTFRCRHHRRRPYFTGSLHRRDSDAEPTHELIKICHNLGIWTDTAWCPTPAGRCLRRKEYYTGRGTDGRGEIWVVYDRLWRSSNKLGQSENRAVRRTHTHGMVWEDLEYGHEGEPLDNGLCNGSEGKMLPAHLRRSHKMFVEAYKCNDCGKVIEERCEICSVRMHCMGCRKTLCASCAFSRPLPDHKSETSSEADDNLKAAEVPPKDKFWWAPGEIRSPNIMKEEEGLNVEISLATIRLKQQWCCLQRSYSGSNGFGLAANGVDKERPSRLRTVPLPRGKGWEDHEFAQLRLNDKTFPRPLDPSIEKPDWAAKKARDRINYWLSQPTGSDEEVHEEECPRNLCQECYDTEGWQGMCQHCHEAFCLSHDLRGLKMRICGYRPLALEKKLRESKKNMGLLNHSATVIFTTPGFVKFMSCWLKKQPYDIEEIRNQEIPEGGILSSDELDDVPSPLLASFRCLCSKLLNEGPDNMDQTIASLSDWVVGAVTGPGEDYQRALRSILPAGGWSGCAALLCSETRTMGDHRPACAAVVQTCSTCCIHVCSECLSKNLPCNCSYCTNHYNCPNCFAKMKKGDCKKLGEDELEKAWQVGKDQANIVAEQMGEFFSGLIFMELVDDTPVAIEAAVDTATDFIPGVLTDLGIEGIDTPV
ncbi:MAG: hypothetical protein MMC33_004804 [Icmadophila ericetorum]|nr:hypothetical protein [Icmadophila ericetorum]